MKVYYAHCIAIYDTPQEARDVALLTSLGFEVDNPNNETVQQDVERLKVEGAIDYMSYFRSLVYRNDVFAFRALPDGRIPSGVAAELGWATEFKKPLIELPSNIGSRTMSLVSTREYLAEVGQR